MRGLPGMTVIVPADCNECEQVIEYAVEHNGPMYIRLSRNNLPNIYPDNYKFNPTKANAMDVNPNVLPIQRSIKIPNIIPVCYSHCTSHI